MINNKVYIGQSKNIEHRFKQHCRKSTNTSLGRDIQRYGKDNFRFDVLEECTESELLERESYYIEIFNSFEPNGYNKAIMSNGVCNVFGWYTHIKVVKSIDSSTD